MRFLGRKVYLGALLVLFGNAALGYAGTAAARAQIRAVADASGIPARTLERWRRWWTAHVPSTRWWTTLAPRFMPPVDIMTLPASLLLRVQAANTGARVTAMLALTRPLSTCTCSHLPMLDAGTHKMV